MEAKHLGSAIRSARIEAGLTQTQVALALGYSGPGSICGVEAGRTPVSLARADRILAAIERLGAEGAPVPPPHPIRDIRIAAGLSQREVARGLGFHHQSRLAQMERSEVRMSQRMERRVLDAIARLAAAKAGGA